MACSLVLSAADVVEVTSDGVEAARYASLEAALAACSGGETLTLLGDVTVEKKLEVSKSVAFDLAGKTLSNRSGFFICPTEAVGTLSFRNGQIKAADCCFYFDAMGSYTVSVSNVAFSGNCVLYAPWTGNGGTLEVLEDCSETTPSWGGLAVFNSRSAGSRCIVRGGVVKGNIFKIGDGKAEIHAGKRLEVRGGSFVQDPTAVVAPGYVVEKVDHEVKGVACAYRVREAADGERGVATVTCADGAVRGCASVDAALAACAPGGVVTLLADCTAAYPLAWDTALTLDLAGHALSRPRSGALFAPLGGAARMTVKGGRCEAADVLLSSVSGAPAEPVAFTNCTLAAQVVCTGAYTQVELADCRAAPAFFFASGSKGTVAVSGGAYRVEEARDAVRDATDARIVATGGRFSFDVTDGLPSGYVQVCEDAVVEGLACRYVVLLAAEAATRPTYGHGALVLSADGAATNGYTTVLEAIAACPEGGRVKMLASYTASGSFYEVPRSMTLDLNGFTLANTGGDFLKILSGVTLDVDGGGGILKGTSWASIFHLGSGDAVVNVADCTLKGLCTLYGPSGAVVNLHERTFVLTTYFASGNATASLNVRGGRHAFVSWRDAPYREDPNLGTRITIFGGRFEKNPLATSLANLPPAIAEGATSFYEEGVSYRGISMPYAVYPDDETATWTREAVRAGLVHTNVNAALRAAQALGGTVRLLADIAHTVDVPSGTASPLTLAFDGHRVVGRAESGDTSAFRLTAAGVACVLDGASVSAACLVDWGAGGTGSSLAVVGDGTNTCTALLASGSAASQMGTLAIRGGRWAVDPTAYVTNNHVVLHRADAAPCPWRVRDWTKLAANGWDFDLEDPLLGATASGTVEAATVEVALAGLLPARRTLLADLSGVTVTDGTLKFVPSSDLPRSVNVVFENNRLIAWQATGTVLVFR